MAITCIHKEIDKVAIVSVSLTGTGQGELDLLLRDIPADLPHGMGQLRHDHCECGASGEHEPGHDLQGPLHCLCGQHYREWLPHSFRLDRRRLGRRAGCCACVHRQCTSGITVSTIRELLLDGRSHWLGIRRDSCSSTAAMSHRVWRIGTIPF